jgi:hypothetical protein
MIPDIKKRIKDLVSDPARLAAIQEAVKTYEQAGDQLDKKQKSYNKLLEIMIEKRGTSKAELTALFTAVLEALKAAQRILVWGNSFLIANLTQEEFSALHSPDAKKTAQREEKRKDAVEKVKEDSQQSLDKIRTLATEIIPDPVRQQAVFSAVQDYQDSLGRYFQEYNKWNLRDNEVLTDYNSSEAQMQELIDELNGSRVNMYTAFIELYLRLSDVCNDEEWKAAVKALKKTSKAAR